MNLLKHPQSSHQIELLGHTVHFALLRRQRRTIAMRVTQEGLEVLAPMRVAVDGVISTALQSKAQWIVSKLQTASEKAVYAEDWQWQDGMYLPWLGNDIRVRCLPILGRSAPEPFMQHGELHLPVAANTPDKIKTTLMRWCQTQARNHFSQRLQHFEQMMGVRHTQLRIMYPKACWGTSRINGHIALHWGLMHFSPEVVDYVVVHELAHLHQMNHSPWFWAHVAAVLPDYKARQKELKAGVLPPWKG